jgi:hypothetical protein
MKPTDLSPDERAVFGHDAVRLPDGTIQERGIGSDFHREQIAAVLRREAICRGEIPAVEPPPGPPAESETPTQQRTIDPRLICDWPTRPQ